MLGSVATHDRLAQKVGADGMEVTALNPRFSRFMRQVLREANLLEAEQANPIHPYGMLGYGLDAERDRTTEHTIRKVVHSQHASFKSESEPPNLLSRLLPTQLIFPSRGESLGYMRRVQKITGKLPAVLYTNYTDIEGGQIRYGDKNEPFASRTFQPKKSDWGKMGLSEDSSVADIKAVMTRRGLSGVTLDLFHILEFDDPEALAAKLAGAGLVDAVHVSVGRTDITGFFSKAAAATRKARRAFTHSAEAASETPEGKILNIVLSSWQDLPDKKRRIVIERGPYDLFQKTHKLARIIMNTSVLIDRARTTLPN